MTNRVANEGKAPIQIVPGPAPTPQTGPQGVKGDKGDRPTFSEIQIAVATYCASSGICEGQSPSPAAVYAAVLQYCTNTDCKGVNGKDGTSGVDGAAGKDAQPITDEQIQAQVVAYCQANRCRGEDGATGPQGVAGKTPVISCVIRDSGSYVAWKSEGDLDASYKDLYRIPALTSCSEPVDLRET